MSKTAVDLSFREISQRLAACDFPEVAAVIGIATGGIVPASLVAFHLEKELHLIHINYRNPDNSPRYDQPQLLNAEKLDYPPGTPLLLVDDVSVSGKTLAHAQALLRDFSITTFTLKGRADLVLFPEVGSCVNWPWKITT